jgi:hypothetical protein
MKESANYASTHGHHQDCAFAHGEQISACKSEEVMSSTSAHVLH